MASELDSPARFTPLRTASPLGRALVLILGPVLWLAAVFVAGLVLYGRDAIEMGVVVTVIAFLLALPFCWLGRRRRLRERPADAA